MEIFRTYDIRGRVPDDLNGEIVYRIGRSLVLFLKTKKIVVGRDCRTSSPALMNAFVKGVTDQGCDVVDIGVCSTPVLYFASKDGPAAMITASHMTKEFNGLKFCGKGAIPIGAHSGLLDIKKVYSAGSFPSCERKGVVSKQNILQSYVKHCLSFANYKSLSPLKVVVDAGNGMGGIACEEIFKSLPCEIVKLFFEPDGDFPNHEPNPVKPENLKDLQLAVKKHSADIGAAYDADADRILFVDEKGGILTGDIVLGLLAKECLKKSPNAAVLYDLRATQAVPEEIKKFGGTPVRTVVGHALIKPLMKKHNAVLGGELSGHFYYKDNQNAESGDITLLLMLKLLSDEKKTLSELAAPFRKYAHSGEINFEVADREGAIEKIKSFFKDAQVDTLDGITLSFDNWWLNARPSRNDPVLRVVVEAEDKKMMKEKVALITKIISKL